MPITSFNSKNPLPRLLDSREPLAPHSVTIVNAASPQHQKVAEWPNDIQPGLLTKGLTHLEKQPLLKLIVMDVAAFNFPKMLLTRTRAELFDTGILEGSNSFITAVGSLIMPRALRHLAQWLSGLSAEDLKKEIDIKALGSHVVPTSLKLARLGVAFGFLFPFAAAFWAAAFVRNWLTMNRTQSANFESMIGFNNVSNRPKRSLKEEMNYQKNTALSILGAGVGLGAASLFGFTGLSRWLKQQEHLLLEGQVKKTSGFSHWINTKGRKGLDTLFHEFDLKGKGANQIGGRISTLVFWGLPAYLGWIHAARGQNERRERTLQSGNSLFWFFLAPVIANRLWQPQFVKAGHNMALWKPSFIEGLKANTRKELAALDEEKNTVLSPEESEKRFEAAFDKKFKETLAGISYADLKANFSTDPAHQDALKKFLRLKNLKFGISELAVPIISLSIVQFLNFALTAHKLKATGVQPKPIEGLAAGIDPETNKDGAEPQTLSFFQMNPFTLGNEILSNDSP